MALTIQVTNVKSEEKSKDLVIVDVAEQLNKAENKLGKIRQDAIAAEKHLDQLEKCCGCFVLPWKK